MLILTEKYLSLRFARSSLNKSQTTVKCLRLSQIEMFQYTVCPYFSIRNFENIIFKRTYRFACNITGKMIVNDHFSFFALIN